MVALAESMIGGDRSNSDTPAVPRQPLPLREFAASDRNSRSSTCDTAGKGGRKLSGQEQDAVVAKIRSTVQKRFSSSEKNLPFQDDDTSNTREASVKKEMEDSNSKKGGPSCKLRSTALSKTASPAKHGNSHLMPLPSHKADLNNNSSGFRAPSSTTSRREAQEAQVAAASSKATKLAQVEAAATASRTRAALEAEKERERESRKALAEKATAEEERREAQAKEEARAREAAFKAAGERTVKEKADRGAEMRKRNDEDRKREADKGEHEKRAHAIAAEAFRQAELKRKEEEAKIAATAAEAAETTAAAAVAAANAVRAKAETAAVALKRAQQHEFTSATKPPTPPRPSGKAAPINGKPASANKGFGSPGRFRTPTAKILSRKVNPYAKDSISTPGPSGFKLAAHRALNRVNVKPSTSATAASGGNDTHTPSWPSGRQDAFAKFRAMDSNSKKGGRTPKLCSTALSKTASPTKHGNSHLMPPPSHKADVNNNSSGFRAPSSTTSKREAQEAQAAAASSKATKLAQVEAAATASRTRAALAAEKERERESRKALAEKAIAEEERREAQAKEEARAREAAFKAAGERTVKEKAGREVEMRKRNDEDRKREVDTREHEKRAHAIAAEAFRQAELKRKEEEAKIAAAAAEAAETTAAAAVAAANAVRTKAETAAAALKRAQQHEFTSATKPPTPPRPSGKAAPINGKPASANKGFGSPGRFRTPTAKILSRKVNPYAKDSISTPGPSGFKLAAHRALNRVNVKPSTSATAASGGNDTHTPSWSSSRQDAFAKFRAMDSNSKKEGRSSKLCSTALSKTASPTKHGNSHLMPPPSHKADLNSSSSGSRAPSSTTSKREAQEAQAAAASSKATQVAQVEAAATASRTRAALAAEKERERESRKALAEKPTAEEARREVQAKTEARAREAAFKAAGGRTAKEKATRVAEITKRKDEGRKREADKRKNGKRAHAIAAEALRQAELKRKEAEAKFAAAAVEAAEATAAAVVTAAAAVCRKAESVAAALKRAQPRKFTSASKPPTPPRPSGKAPLTPPRPLSMQPGAPTTPPRPPLMQPDLGAQAQAQVQAQTHVQMQAHAYGKAHEANIKAQALVQTPPLASPRTPSKIGASSAAGDKEEHQVELAKKKQQEIAKMGESESESGEDGERAVRGSTEPEDDKSAIPDWARGKTVAKILDRQYGEPHPLNPDSIFGEFFTCDLEHIFNTKKSKWDRSSSGNWHADHPTIAEKLAYQRAMGYEK